MDPFIILPQERARYIDQFNGLKPAGGFVSGDQAKGFLLQSQLPPMVLGHIWELADLNSDGKLDFVEFSIACKLINAKLRGFEIPKILPPALKASASAAGTPPTLASPVLPAAPTAMAQPLVAQPLMQPMVQPMVQPMIQPMMPSMAQPMMQPVMQPMVQPGMQPMVPSSLPLLQNNLVRTMSPPTATAASGFPISSTSFDSSKPNTPDSSKTVIRAASVSSNSSSTEWAVPHATKLKYAQLFNSHDRNKTGFLTGVQARGILVQTQLPQNILACVWQLSDIDMDGRLSSDEFVLAMHLCDVVRAGEKLPDMLPPELIPPTFRRASLAGSASVTSPISGAAGGGGAEIPGSAATSPPPVDELKMMSPTSFEDKRRENFDKGQAELDKRRRALAEQQRREQEERERKEREELERKEKLRLEQERRIQAEMEKKLAKQREIEMEKEEQRRKMLEQREAARKEMERQRQLEWQKQRLQELLQQKQKEQERVALLRANHQRLETELNVLDERVFDLSAKIVETRTGVAETKNTIDGMRTTRDTQMAQLTGLKTQLREQNQRLLAVSQEKMRLEAKNRMNAAAAATSPSGESGVAAAQNIAARQLALNQAKEKLEHLAEELNKKLEDAENNNAQMNNLKADMSALAHRCQQSHQSYLKKREEVLLLRATGGKQKSWSSDDGWGASTASDGGWGTTPAPAAEVLGPKAIQTRYRALYEFVARNGDEISFQPGDIIMVTESLSNEPGWLSGEVRGHVGWFPEAYVEKMDQSASWGSDPAGATGSGVDAKRHHLEGIQELPENVSDNGSIADVGAVPAPVDAGQSAFVPVSARFSADASSSALVQDAAVDSVRTGTVYETASISPRSSREDSLYVAMYPYESSEPGDLTFPAGEMVSVTKKDGDWWTGTTTDGRSGVFPSNYVQKATDVQQYEASLTEADSEVEAATAAADAVAAAKLAKAAASSASAATSSGKRPNTAPIDGEFESAAIGVPRAASAASSGAASPSNVGRGSKKPEIATVIAPYTATSSEQLSLTRGQLIMIRKKSSSGWWEGELQAKGRKRQLGWFPASYVKILSSSGGSSRTTPVPAEMEQDDAPQMPPAAPTETEIQAVLQDQVVALFPYTAQNDDELSFLQGDVVVVIDREDPAWWRGRLKGQEGLFPSNYVEVLGSLAASAALGAAASSAAPQWTAANGSAHAKALAALSPAELNRQAAINELVSTEETYMEDLSVVSEVFQKPMLESGFFKPEDIDAIFVNWKDLIACNNTFLRALRIRKKMSPDGIILVIGDILVDYFPNMSPYVRFCSRQLNAAALIQQRHENVPEFRAFLKQCQMNPKVKGMPLTSYLLKPMQRITKYPLLIKKILELTDIDHPDRLLLDEALHKAEELCTQVNEGVREQENSDRLEWLQRRVQVDSLDERLIFNSLTNMLGPRKLVHFGALKKAKSNKELLVFLFNDFLMFTVANKPLATLNLQFLFDEKSNLAMRIYRKPVFLRDMLTVAGGSPAPGEGSGGEIASDPTAVRFTIQNTERKFLLTSSSSAERILWLRKLEEARKHCLLTERAALQRQRSKHNEGNACGRLLVLVVEAENLQASSATVRQRPPVGKILVVVVEGMSLAARNLKGKSDTFCEVYIGSQEHRTKVVPNSLNPKWNASMQFLVKDLQQDVLCVTVLDRDYFSPNEFLGRTELRISDILQDSKIYRGPLIKRLPLHEVESGEIVLKLDLQLFNKR